MEAYNPKTNDWVFVAPMNTRRSSVGVGVVDGKQSYISRFVKCNLVSALVMKHCFGSYLASPPNSTAYKSLATNANPGPLVSYTGVFNLYKQKLAQTGTYRTHSDANVQHGEMLDERCPFV